MTLHLVQNIHGSTFSRTVLAALFSGELVECFGEMRWMLLAIVVCVVADFWYGRGESLQRYKLAKEKGDAVLMEHFKWRRSRAKRRTVNKTIDYVIWMLLGMLLGKGLFEQVGVSHVWGMWGAAATACICEIQSIGGHFLYLRGVHVEKHSITGFVTAFAIAIAKRKNEDVGEALEEAYNKGKEHENGND